MNLQTSIVSTETPAAEPIESEVKVGRTGSVYSKKPCRHCNTLELKRQPRSFTQWLMFLQPYKCSRCGKREKHLAVSWGMPVLLTAIGGVAAITVHYWNNPLPWDRPANTSMEALARARASSGGQLTPFEEMMVRRPKSTLANSNILELTKAEVRTDVIVRLIRASEADFDLTANAIIDLKKQGVDESVILAMIDQSSSYTR